jgi:hypothetical protein
LLYLFNRNPYHVFGSAPGRRSGTAPTFAPIVREWAAKIMTPPVWKNPAALVITFGEGGGGGRAGGGGKVATIVVTSDGSRGVRSNRRSNHSSLLWTLEDTWRLHAR